MRPWMMCLPPVPVSSVPTCARAAAGQRAASSAAHSARQGRLREKGGRSARPARRSITTDSFRKKTKGDGSSQSCSREGERLAQKSGEGHEIHAPPQEPFTRRGGRAKAASLELELHAEAQGRRELEDGPGAEE